MPDTTAPNLTSLSFTPTVNLGGGPQPISFTVGATDDQSGVFIVDIWFANSLNYTLPPSSTVHSSRLVDILGTPTDTFADGQLTETFNLTTFNTSGTYTIDHIDVFDLAHNQHTYTTAQLAALGAQTSFTIQGGTADTTAPTLTSLSFQPVIDLSGGAQPITFTVGATDDASGVNGAVIVFTNGLYVTDILGSLFKFPMFGVLDAIDSFSDGQSANTFTISPFNAAGTYTIDHIDVFDNANNTRTYNAAQLAGLGIATSVTVQGGTPDTTAPTLTSLSFQPIVNISGGNQPITFTVGATDDLSGISNVNITLADAITTEITPGNNASSPFISVPDGIDSFSDGQSANTSTLTTSNAPGVYSIDHVDVFDKIGNVHTYSAAQLAALGASTSFTIVGHGPVITSNGGHDTAGVTVAENTTAVTTVSAIDGDSGATVGYAVVGGADMAKFAVDPVSGALSFVAAPNFENPTDADHNNSYVVQVRAADASHSDVQTITVGVTDVFQEPGKPKDFNGDLSGDVFWQNDDGHAALWMMQGTSPQSMGVLRYNGPTVHAKASADLNGDGKADILWQNDDGAPAFWLMDGTRELGSGNLRNNGPTWHIADAADFNGDGKADVLWQNDDGSPAMWLMDGTSELGGGNLRNNGPTWHIKAAADFNGDGKADILWQNDDGSAAIWLMDGTRELGGGNLRNNGPTWHAEGATDVNDDGKADIIWLSDSGSAAVWLMNGTTELGGANLPQLDGSWHLV